jgi:phosphoribosylanthranilate isomerase
MTNQSMSPVRIKICGITSTQDALLALNAGADAIGLVFYAPSPRYIDLQIAKTIALAVGPFVTLVGLFVDPEEAFVRDILAQVPLHVLQFHGNEAPEFCDIFKRPYMKAIRMRPDLDVEKEMSRFPEASAILLDAYRPGVPGGTGETFDWQRIPNKTVRPIVLAGGLTPENVALAMSSSKVYGVDVSSGVEWEPGKKDPIKLQTFIYNAKKVKELDAT